MTYPELFQKSETAGIKNSILAAPLSQEDIDFGYEVTCSISFFTYAWHADQKGVFKGELSVHMKYYVTASWITRGQKAGEENEKIFYLGSISTKNQLTNLNIFLFTYWKYFQKQNF